MKSLRVAIIPGFTETQWHAKKLKNELIKNHFEVVENVDIADVIITHSAGCFIAPKHLNNCLFIFIGPPYWPNKLLVSRLINKISIDSQYFIKNKLISYWLHKTLRSAVNLVFLPHRWLHMWWRYLRADPKVLFKDTVVIWNEDDTFSHEKYIKVVALNFYKLPGIHDDVWVNPKPYVEIIKKHLANF